MLRIVSELYDIQAAIRAVHELRLCSATHPSHVMDSGDLTNLENACRYVLPRISCHSFPKWQDAEPVRAVTLAFQVIGDLVTDVTVIRKNR